MPKPEYPVENNLAPYKRPERIVHYDHPARTAAGKTDQKTPREMLGKNSKDNGHA